MHRNGKEIVLAVSYTHLVRFACFRQAAQEWQCNKLALGHHRDDRAESVLLHLIQGCGLDGLTAMPVSYTHLRSGECFH